MPRTTDFNRDNPTPELLKMGEEFGTWFRAALANANVPGVRVINVYSLARENKISKTVLYYWRDNCIDAQGSFRKPSPGLIRKVARILGADETIGLRAMGYDGDREKFGSVPATLVNLPPNQQQALAHLIDLLKPDGQNITLSSGLTVRLGSDSGKHLTITPAILAYLEYKLYAPP